MKSSGHKLCKTWIKKRWKHLKKFAKKHKAALIIGTAVAVATVAVVFVVAAASTAAVASVTGLMTEGIDTKLPPHAIQNDSMGTEITSNDKLILSHNESSILQTAIEEHVTTFKETISKDCLGVIENESKGHEDAALGEKARNLGSTLAHEALDGIAQLAVCVPELLEEIKEIGKHILPNTLLLEGNEITPKQKFNNVVGRGHEKIDQIFSTERSILYSPEAKDARNQCDLGMIPFSALVEAQFAAAGQVLDRGGFTKAGRSLMKHGYREGSVFPKPTGNAAQINEHAQQILESILNHPEKVIFERPHPDFGKIIDIKIPNKGGVRFSIDGNMIGFLEP